MFSLLGLTLLPFILEIDQGLEKINPNLESSYLVQSGYLLTLTTGENLVLISQTTFEKLKFEDFFSSKCPPLCKKIVFENYFFT